MRSVQSYSSNGGNGRSIGHARICSFRTTRHIRHHSRDFVDERQISDFLNQFRNKLAIIFRHQDLFRKRLFWTAEYRNNKKNQSCNPHRLNLGWYLNLQASKSLLFLYTELIRPGPFLRLSKTQTGTVAVKSKINFWEIALVHLLF